MAIKKPGTLYLLPSPLAENAWHTMPAEALALMQRLQFYVVENGKSARKCLRGSGFTGPLEPIVMSELNEHTDLKQVPKLLAPILQGHDMGLLSEAGLPCVADPGQWLVRAAHAQNITVKPISGPSSLMLALMASGLNGQNFLFNGYLPQDQGLLQQRLRAVEQLMMRTDQTQIWIETPYRNNKMLQVCLNFLPAATQLCVAVDLCAPTEWIFTARIEDWKRRPLPELHKRPAVWLMGK